MHTARVRLTRGFGILLLSLLVICPAAGIRASQNSPAASGQQEARSAAPSPDYQIGPGDILAITVSDAPEFSGKFRVSQSGDLEFASLPAPLHVQGMTTGQAAKTLTQALIDAKLYQSPTVNVYVDEFHSRTVTVVGAVNKPSVYPLQKRTTVLELVSQAGGLLPTAGNKLTIVSSLPPGAGEGGQDNPVRKIDLARLMRGEDPSLNVEVHDGEVVSISSAEVVYVVGAVTKPGGFVLPDQSSGCTALQALALAEGLTSVASSSRALIIHRGTNGAPSEDVPIDLKKLLARHTSDVTLQANDILFVPVSGGKVALHTMKEAAMSAVNGIAFYGAGYRAAGIN